MQTRVLGKDRLCWPDADQNRDDLPKATPARVRCLSMSAPETRTPAQATRAEVISDSKPLAAFRNLTVASFLAFASLCSCMVFSTPQNMPRLHSPPSTFQSAWAPNLTCVESKEHLRRPQLHCCVFVCVCLCAPGIIAGLFFQDSPRDSSGSRPRPRDLTKSTARSAIFLHYCHFVLLCLVLCRWGHLTVLLDAGNDSSRKSKSRRKLYCGR